MLGAAIALLFPLVVYPQSNDGLLSTTASSNYTPMAEPQRVTISGAQPVTLDLTGYDPNGLVLSFAIHTQPTQGTLGPIDQANGQVVYTPASSFSGSDSFSFSVADGVRQSKPATVAITVRPQALAAFSLSTLDFGGEILNSSSDPKPITLTNIGNTALGISDVSISGDFAQTNNCGSSVVAGSACTINVTFTPAAAGPRSGVLTITDNSSTTTQTISVTGSGMDFIVAVSGDSSGSVTIVPGGVAVYGLSISPQGGFNQTVTLSCSGAPSEAICVVSPGSITLDGAKTSSATVTVTTTSQSHVLPEDSIRLDSSVTASEWILACFVVIAVSSRLAIFANKRFRTSISVLCLVLVTSFLTACGGGGSGASQVPSGTASGSYSLTITASSGSLVQNTMLQLVVK